MKVVERLEQFPSTCLVTGNPEGPFVDFEANYDQAQVGLHVEVVKEAARMLGMVDREEIAEIQAALGAMDEEITRLRAITDKSAVIAQLREELAEEVAV